jgi:hypothetical protein
MLFDILFAPVAARIIVSIIHLSLGRGKGSNIIVPTSSSRCSSPTSIVGGGGSTADRGGSSIARILPPCIVCSSLPSVFTGYISNMSSRSDRDNLIVPVVASAGVSVGNVGIILQALVATFTSLWPFPATPIPLPVVSIARTSVRGDIAAIVAIVEVSTSVAPSFVDLSFTKLTVSVATFATRNASNALALAISFVAFLCLADHCLKLLNLANAVIPPTANDRVYFILWYAVPFCDQFRNVVS